MEEYVELNLSKDTEEIAVDSKKYFTINYIPKIDEYFLCPVVTWIAWYDRYYLISKDDVELYKTNPEEFYEKYSRTIGQQTMYDLTGSCALRDYCIVQGLSTGVEKETNIFQNHIWWKNFLWAKILWDRKYYLVLPNTEVPKEFVDELGLKNIPDKDNSKLFGLYFCDYDK